MNPGLWLLVASILLLFAIILLPTKPQSRDAIRTSVTGVLLAGSLLCLSVAIVRVSVSIWG